jgi:hypothetical protein
VDRVATFGAKGKMWHRQLLSGSWGPGRRGCAEQDEADNVLFEFELM